jgi:hydroxymethylpyrimidine/phosphomethylpyrimidine kinase
MPRARSALTIAGSDSGGGAGIQADLKSFAAVGVHGCSVLTCATAQHTRGVLGVYPLSAAAVTRQLDAVLDDFDVRAAKTGMLYSGEIARAVAGRLEGARFPVVVDPVMVATVGASLRGRDLRDALVERVLPGADLVTPNLFEAEELAGFPVDSVESMRNAAKRLHGFGAGAVLVKGGHLRGRLVDVLFDGRRVHAFEAYRYPRELHGSGCTLAASIAAYLALGRPLRTAVALGRRRVAAAFHTAYRPGRGVAVIRSDWSPDRYAVAAAVEGAAHALAAILPVRLVPEVGVNLAYAVEGAADLEDVCGLTGRIHRIGDRLAVAGSARFGASRHVARIVLTAMRFDPAVRCAANVKYREGAERALRALRMAVGAFDRSRQPERTSTMEWGTDAAIRALGRVPDAIWDAGGHGKEGMVRVLGRDPADVLAKVRRLARRLA